MTLHTARTEAQKVFTARREGRDPASEKREGKRRITADRVEVLIETFHAQHLVHARSGQKLKRILEREVVSAWRGKSVSGTAPAWFHLNRNCSNAKSH